MVEKLTKDFFMKVPVTLSAELGLDRPVYMGSSIGGHLATDLALHYPEKFRAVIGLEAALATPGGYRDS
jgi:pimeloyl-ACP methyl ester carboxylesterase